MPKPGNGRARLEALSDLPPRERQTFERDYRDGVEKYPQLRRAGRSYAAYGWRIFRDAVMGTGRRRKMPGECRVKQCPCLCHRGRTEEEHVEA